MKTLSRLNCAAIISCIRFIFAMPADMYNAADSLLTADKVYYGNVMPVALETNGFSGYQ